MRIGKKLSILAGIVLSLTVSISHAAEWSQESFPGGLNKVHVYVPESTSPIGEGRALFVVLRGCLQPASAFKTANLDKIADEYGMIIAAAEPNTSAGADCWGYYSGIISRTSGDYKNVISTTETLIADTSLDIDPDQVYIGGLSSGGAFAMITGCLAPEIYAGMALDAAPSAGTGMMGAFSHEGTAASTKANCEGYAGSNKSYFATQITTTAYGTIDGTVPKTYGLQNAEAMALIYGETQTDEENQVQGFSDVKESTWTNGRVSMVEFGGVGHAWPAGSGASGSYIDATSADYGKYMAEFFVTNNQRVEDEPPVETCNNVTINNVTYNESTKIFTANGNVTENCDEAMVFLNVANSADFTKPENDFYSFEVGNVDCPAEIKVTLENASGDQFQETLTYTGSCGNEEIAPEITSFNGITTTGTVSLTGTARDTDGTIVSTVITLDGTDYPVEINSNGVFTKTISGLAAREYTARVIVTDNDGLTDDALTTFEIKESEKLGPTLTLGQIAIDDTYAVLCGNATDADGEIIAAVYSIDGSSKQINMNPDGSFCVHMPDLEYGEHELIIAVADNDGLGVEKIVTFTTTEVIPEPPVVTLNSVIVEGKSATITGNATDTDGTIVSVTLDVNGVAYTVVLTSAGDFSKTLTDLEVGQYTATATAEDNDGLTAADSADFEIKEIPKVAPEVSVTASVNGTTATISGSATDSDGNVVSVVIEVNGTEYTVAGGNFSKTITDLEPGQYDVTAVATDNDGLTDTAATSFTIEEVGSCVAVTGKVNPDLVNAGLVKKSGWYYFTTGDNNLVWSWVSYTLYQGADGKGYKTEATCTAMN